jgi:hypothetical protein
MIDSERPRWKWTYHDISTSRVTQYGVTWVGSWESDDDREEYKYIRVDVTDDGRFCPWVPYWWGALGGPDFGHPSTFPRCGTLKDAIAFCETYLAKHEKDW